MKRKIWTGLWMAGLLTVGAAGGSVLAAQAAAEPAIPVYQTNANGETYGSVNPRVMSEEEYPDLIAAIGEDGTEGYVRKSELYTPQPSSPEEAVAYMEKLQARAQAAARAGLQHTRYIPLYAEDGETILGDYGIGSPQEVLQYFEE